MIGTPESIRKGTWTHATGAAASTVTLAATANVTHVVDCIHWSYATGSATKGALTITINGVVAWDVDLEMTLTTEGALNTHGSFIFPNGIYGNPGEALVMTLEDNDSVSKLNVHSY